MRQKSMAEVILMPKQGNTVESCIIVDWQKGVGEQITTGDVLCTVETDKATLEVESTASGTILALYFEEGDDIPVLTPIAAIGEPGDDFAGLEPDGALAGRTSVTDQEATQISEAGVPGASAPTTHLPIPSMALSAVGISPRAKNLAQNRGLEIADVVGTGPGGRIIERDILAEMANQTQLTPVASRMMDKGEFVVPETGSGIGGRITSKDLIPGAGSPEVSPVFPAERAPMPDDVREIPVQGVRKVIAERLLHSLQTTAQLTLNASADARALLAYRKRLKKSSELLGLRDVTIGDLVLYAVSRTLTDFPDLNALFIGDSISLHKHVHLALAVDTPRGLVVPVIRYADTLSLKKISLEAKRLAVACQDGRIALDELTGGTFTVTNLGTFGIESFTPILNPPQVGILGVGSINPKPVIVNGEVQFIPHIGLSLTVNHQVVDGAPGARFLQALSGNLANLELLLAL
jgi:pyruvate dehydrogenase E2 component (dihydrolipoamide acetyltransferase)